MSDVEVVRTEDVVSRRRRRKEIDRLDAAVNAAQQSTVEIAEAITECEVDEAWLEDDDFAHYRATHPGALAEFGGWRFGLWIGWRYGFRTAYAAKMLHFGRVRKVLATGSGRSSTTVEELPRNERQARPLSKAMNARTYESLGEYPDEAARNEAVRRIWRAALKGNDGDPAKAAKHFKAFAKDDPYEPVAREYRDTTSSLEQQEQRKARRLGTFRRVLRALLRAGWRDDVAAIIDEELG